MASAYKHGVYISELPTQVIAPITGTAGLQVVVGTAPVNLVEDPAAAVNTPILANSYKEAVAAVGYSNDFANYTLCESISACFNVVGVGPIVMINVLDPAKHKKTNPVTTIPVKDGVATLPIDGVLLDSVKVTYGVSGSGTPHEKYGLDEGTCYGTNCKDLVCPGTMILENGDVIGTIPYATTTFGDGKGCGYYMPVNLGDEFKSVKKFKIKKTIDDQETESGEIENDPQMVVCLGTDAEKAKAAKIEFFDVSTEPPEHEKNPFLTLTFTGCTFLDQNKPRFYSEGSDYTIGFDDDGHLVVTLVGEEASKATSIAVVSDSLDPSQIKDTDIVGSVDAQGNETGLQVIRQVYPKLGMTPGIITCPRWSENATVAAAMQAKTKEVSGVFRANCIVDVCCKPGEHSGDDTAAKYSDVKSRKEKQALTDPNCYAVWLYAKVGDVIYSGSSLASALTAYTDAANSDTPNVSPSNKAISISAACLSDGTEVVLDQDQANTVNSFGVATWLNVNGFRLWGNNTVAYPSTTDPKDRWFSCRRFLNWAGNTFILTYFQKVDSPLNKPLIEAIVDSERIRGNSFVARGVCARYEIAYLEEENPTTELLNGHVKFHQYCSPFPPAENIEDCLEFDANALSTALA